MIYASEGDSPTRNVPTSKAERSTFVLDDREILTLARWACAIERHYGCPMDMEWAKDGESGEMFIVQARPETVQSRREASAFKSYRVKSKGRTLVTGPEHRRSGHDRPRLPDRKSRATSTASSTARSWSRARPTRTGCRSCGGRRRS